MAFDREKRFAADAAHELRTPISVLKVQLHNLLHDLNTRQLPEPVLQPARLSLQELGDGIDRLAHLIEQILVLNRTAPAQYMRQFLPVDLLELVQHVVSNEFDHFLARDQIFSLDGLPVSIAGDKTALQSLVQNLLINASKYTPAGGQINVAIGREGSKVVLQLEDSGPGIPEAQYEQVFDRFYRLSDEQHDLAVSGSGLGLAIVKHIVNMHQAEIRLSRSLSLGGLCVKVLFKQYPQEKSV
jgi:two-component system sensor histidine kinase QseC